MRRSPQDIVGSILLGLTLTLLLAGGFVSVPPLVGASPNQQADCPAIAAPVEAASAVGCRQLVIQATEAGFTLPTQVEAGLTLVTFENGAAAEVEPEIARLPADVTLADLQADLVGGETAPVWFYETAFAGGPGTIPPSGRSQAIVNLTPGEYVVFSVEDIASASTLSVVAPAAPSERVEPQATATVTVSEMAFGFPAELAAGPQLWQVVNAGQQPHQLTLVKVPDGTTLEQVQHFLTSDPSASPDPASPDLSQIVTVGGLAFLSAGQTAWAVLDLAPGTYVALCWIPDQASGMPHAFMGMIAVFTIAA